MKTIEFDNISLVQKLFGFHNTHLDKIAKNLGVTINSRGNSVTISGDAENTRLAHTLLLQLYGLLQENIPMDPADLDAAISLIKKNGENRLKPLFSQTVFVTAKNKPIRPRSLAQQKYVNAIQARDIVFGIGPAGTGKTYLAMAMAVAALCRGDVQKIILTRPAVEAGEALGFLPGDLAEKINPYLRPLYDALYDMLDFEKARAYIDQEIIEIAPIAFMRGRTLNNAFIILDEAQNTTSQQMKMFLTRIGYNSKAVVTGDITQIDLPAGKKSGLVEVRKILSRIKGIDFIYFSKADVVRHQLVSDIIDAYEKNKT
ncbi:MAG: PhoH family protein [Desulfotignum sp.]|jgi:phosphate starvation-inducible PhoH-like protein|nr:PhoH family protein [Desulfotignum sp.]